LFLSSLSYVVFITTGYFYYKYQVAYLTKENQGELAAIVDLKVNQIVAWRQERTADALRKILQSGDMDRVWQAIPNKACFFLLNVVG
jgi:hypothetical protein